MSNSSNELKKLSKLVGSMSSVSLEAQRAIEDLRRDSLAPP